LACLVFNCTLNAQIFKHGFPESYAFKNKETRIPVKMLDAIDTAAYRAEDVKKGIPNRYGVVQQVTIDIKAMGLKTEIPGKGTIWQYKIQSPQTYSLSIRFVDFFLPEGASVFIYNDTHTRKSGAFTSQNNKDNYELSIADFKGNHAIIEYFEPFEPEFEGELVIGSVAQSYKDISKGMLQPGLGEIGINCPQGANWQTVKHAV